MKKLVRNQAGVAHLGLIVLIVGVIAAIIFVGTRVLGDSDVAPQNAAPKASSQESAAEKDIVLQNFGLRSLQDVDVTSQAVREYDSRGLKGFYVFGDDLGKDDNRKNPNFEFASVKGGAPVIAAIDGTITFIREQADSKDFEVMLQPKEGSKWTIGYDHLINLKVSKGDTVKAGDILGEPAVQNNGLRRFELQINKDEASTLHICPSTLLDPAKKDSLLAELTAMQNSWESTTGLELYDTAVQAPPGCLLKTLTPQAAEGR